MKQKRINPWTWQDELSFSQGWRIDGGSSMFYVSGQGGLDANKKVVAKDFATQARQAMENIKTVLQQGGFSMSDIVKFTVYLTNMDNIKEFHPICREYCPKFAASTAVGVTRLALPDMVVEIEAIAVR